MISSASFSAITGGQDNGQDQGSGSGSNDNQLAPEGIGTGFFFDSSGYILTNQHVVGDADQIQVTVQGYNNRSLPRSWVQIITLI